MNCPFCAIVTDSAPAVVVARWRDALAIEPLNPVTPGHTLIISRRHIANALEDGPLTGYVFQCAAEFAATDFTASGYNLITSVGEAATQTVKHLHVHVVPRWYGDGLALPWTASTKAVVD